MVLLVRTKAIFSYGIFTCLQPTGSAPSNYIYFLFESKVFQASLDVGSFYTGGLCLVQVGTSLL